MVLGLKVSGSGWVQVLPKKFQVGFGSILLPDARPRTGPAFLITIFQNALMPSPRSGIRGPNHKLRFASGVQFLAISVQAQYGWIQVGYGYVRV